MQIRNVYGIDLGTSTVKIYDLKKDTITKEKNRQILGSNK